MFRKMFALDSDSPLLKLSRVVIAFVALLPAMFMMFIVISYILWTSEKHGGAIGFGLDLHVSYAIAGIITIFLSTVIRRLGREKKDQ